MASSLVGRIVLDIFRVLGAIMFVGGIVWILQGVNILPGSFMTGQIIWAERGAGAAVVGLILLVIANMRR